MNADPETHNIPGAPDSQENRANRWLILAITILAFLMVAVITYAILASSGVFERQSASSAFITITDPFQGTVLDTTSSISVTGQAGGLFEGSLVIQALNAAGNVLVQQPTIIDSPEAGTGGEGSWAVDLPIAAPPGTQGRILAFSTSPADGSTIASDEVEVVFGRPPPAADQIDLRDHLWVLDALNGRTLIDDTHIILDFQDFLAEGTGGCNLYTTSYESNVSNLNFGLVTSTAKDCEAPPGIMAQEKAYFDALEGVASYALAFQGLNLFDGTGMLNLVFDAAVVGRVVALEGRMLPEGAVVYVQLSDVSLADAEPNPLAEQVIMDVIDFPVPFTITYDPQEIREDSSYAIQVRIEDSSGSLYFSNTSTNFVVTSGNPSQLDVIVDAVQ